MEGLALKVLKDRYARPNEGWEEVCERVATAVALVEKPDVRTIHQRNFKEQLLSRRFFTAGRVLRGAGIDGQNLLNCYVLGVEDTKESIGKLLQNLYIISCMGGGTGVNLSKIRPYLTEIGTDRGFAPGVVSVLAMMDAVGGHALSGGERRGAMIGLLDISHPDLMDFLNAKEIDGTLKNFNLSVIISPEFIKAVEDDKLWSFSFREKTHYRFVAIGSQGGAVQFYAPSKELAQKRGAFALKRIGQDLESVDLLPDIPARVLWETIVKRALKYGEPGIIHLALCNQMNPGWYFESLSGVNPCLGPDERLLTVNGEERIQDLVGKEVEIINQLGEKSKSKVWSAGIRKTVRVTLSSGKEIICTPEHKWLVEGDMEIEARNLTHNYLKSSIHHVFTRGFVTKVEDGPEIEVFDFSEPKTNWGIVNGFVCHNCAELALPAFGACDLGSINLGVIVEEGEIQWSKLKETIKVGVRMLDNILDITSYPISKIEETCKRGRRIGLGVMGLHHLFMELGIAYGSDESIDLIDKLFTFIRDSAYEASIDLSREKGAFPEFDLYRYSQGKFFISLPRKIKVAIKKYGIRNVGIMALAPTGTIHMLAEASSGIEPINRIVIRRDKIGERIIIDPKYKELLLAGRDVSHINNGEDLDPIDHLKVQASIQNYIDGNISKTINVRENWKPQNGEDPTDYFSNLLMSFLPELKGTTIYQSGSREDQVITVVPKDKEEEYITEAFPELSDMCRNGVCPL